MGVRFFYAHILSKRKKKSFNVFLFLFLLITILLYKILRKENIKANVKEEHRLVFF